MLLVSDLHYTLRQLDWVTGVAADYDLVVVAGDHLDIASIVEPDAQIAVMLQYLARIAAKANVVACSGNHDLDAENQHGERAARWLEQARDAGSTCDYVSQPGEGHTTDLTPGGIWWSSKLGPFVWQNLHLGS